jgi:hypothetical protein
MSRNSCVLVAAAIATFAASPALAQSHMDSRECAYQRGSGKFVEVNVRQSFTADGNYDGPRMVLQDGKPVNPDTLGYTTALGRVWHTESQPITLNGRSYVKLDPAEKYPGRIISPTDLKVVGEYDGVALATLVDPEYFGRALPDGTILVHRGDLSCEFEPYVPAP